MLHQQAMSHPELGLIPNSVNHLSALPMAYVPLWVGIYLRQSVNHSSALPMLSMDLSHTSLWISTDRLYVTLKWDLSQTDCESPQIGYVWPWNGIYPRLWNIRVLYQKAVSPWVGIYPRQTVNHPSALLTGCFTLSWDLSQTDCESSKCSTNRLFHTELGFI